MKQRAIFFFWLPLAFSWLLMTFEGPWVQGVISRKPEAELQLAAFGLVMSLSVTIETPVIMFLAVGNALVRDRQSFRVLWRYTMVVNGLVAVLAALMAFTPLLDLWLGNVLGIPKDIIEATRPGMAIMILWGALIGYRRFHQGIMIRHGRTGVVGYGSVLRILVSAGVAVLLGILTGLPGAVIGAIAVILAVGAEAVYVHWASRLDVARALHTERPPEIAPLTYRAAFRFHLPLALTMAMTLLVRPVIDAGLASTDDAELALAAWPVVFSILLVMRAGGLAWQEVVISLSRGPDELRALRRFTWRLGLGLSALLALLAFTPLIEGYIGAVLGIPPSLYPPVIAGTQVALLMPLLTTFQSYLRGLLMRSNTTNPIYQGMALSFLTTAGSMWLGLAAGLPGVPVACLALTLGLTIELAYLWRAFRANAETLRRSWAAHALAEAKR